MSLPSNERNANLKPYADAFFRQVSASGRSSALEIVPLLIELIRPRSVVDVGCGTGAWLARFLEQGIDDVIGIDGPWVDRDALEIPTACFVSTDLTTAFSISRRFDLVVSLETAEHLPPSNAESFVGRLTQLGDVIAFSAAIPRQGGTLHVNEQWPDYWVKLFHSRGYVAIDCVRQHIWNNPRVAWWYSQNMILFVQADRARLDERIRPLAERFSGEVLPLVHPRKYLETWSEFDATVAESRSRRRSLRRFETALVHCGRWLHILKDSPPRTPAS